MSQPANPEETVPIVDTAIYQIEADVPDQTPEEDPQPWKELTRAEWEKMLHGVDLCNRMLDAMFSGAEHGPDGPPDPVSLLKTWRAAMQHGGADAALVDLQEQLKAAHARAEKLASMLKQNAAMTMLKRIQRMVPQQAGEDVADAVARRLGITEEEAPQ